MKRLATPTTPAAPFLEELFQAADPRQARGEMPDARELLRRRMHACSSQAEAPEALPVRRIRCLMRVYLEDVLQ